MATPGTLLAAALGYAGRGWPVFPCRPDSPTCPSPGKCECKAPVTHSGFKNATTNPARIRAWWAARPECNVAIATGAPGPDVLDIDVKPAGSGFPALNRLKRAGLVRGATALIRTRSGGMHIYFTGTAEGCHSLPRQHVDLKAAGGYVLAPPSRIHGSPYELIEQRDATGYLNWAAIRNLLDPPRRKPPQVVTWKGDDLPAGVMRALAADATDRSAALHRLVGACVRAGMDEDSIHQLASGYQPALEKYGTRLAAEVERSMRRIGV